MRTGLKQRFYNGCEPAQRLEWLRWRRSVDSGSEGATAAAAASYCWTGSWPVSGGPKVRVQRLSPEPVVLGAEVVEAVADSDASDASGVSGVSDASGAGADLGAGAGSVDWAGFAASAAASEGAGTGVAGTDLAGMGVDASARRRAFLLAGFPCPVSIPRSTCPAGAKGTPEPGAVAASVAGSTGVAGGTGAGRAAVRPLPAPGLRAKTDTTGKTPVVGSAARISLRVIGGFGVDSAVDPAGAEAAGVEAVGVESVEVETAGAAEVEVAGTGGVEAAGAEGVDSSELLCPAAPCTAGDVPEKCQTAVKDNNRRKATAAVTRQSISAHVIVPTAVTARKMPQRSRSWFFCRAPGFTVSAGAAAGCVTALVPAAGVVWSAPA